MPKKRRSGGRSRSGQTGHVQCTKCGKLVPRDKAKRVTRRVSFIEPRMVKELKQQGAYILQVTSLKYLCVSCAVHSHVVKIRSKDERKSRKSL